MNVHGFEIVLNYFFAQIVGQALFWWLVWFSVIRSLKGRSSVSTAVPIAILAVLSTYIHGVPSVELLVIVGCLATAETVTRWRDGRRGINALVLPFGLFLATGVAISVMPPFRAQRGFAKHDGYLEVDYVTWPVGHVTVALAVVVVSAILLALSLGGRLDRPTAVVLGGFAFAGISIAAPFFAQLALLALGEGSPYSVKKYAFGLIAESSQWTCVSSSPASSLSQDAFFAQTGPDLRLWRRARDRRHVRGVPATGPVRYFTSQMVDLERRVEAVRSSGDLGDDRRDYAVELVGSDVWLDWHVSRPRSFGRATAGRWIAFTWARTGSYEGLRISW